MSSERKDSFLNVAKDFEFNLMTGKSEKEEIKITNDTQETQLSTQNSNAKKIEQSFNCDFCHFSTPQDEVIKRHRTGHTGAFNNGRIFPKFKDKRKSS